MPVSLNNTQVVFNDATTQTTSGVTAVNVSTGISSSGGKTPTLTNTGVTSIVAGSGISINQATGAVTVTAAGGGVTSLNGQTGAITNTNFDVIGSYAVSIIADTSANPNVSDKGAVSYSANTTYAGSRLRYGRTFSYAGQNVQRNITEGYSRSVGGRTGVGYADGGAAYSGTWRLMSGANITSDYDTENNNSQGNWSNGLFVRIS